MVKKYLSDWKVHLICLIFVIIAEFIGIRQFKFGIIAFSLLPMLYVLIFGMILGGFKAIDKETMETAAPYINISVSWLIANVGASIGPNIATVIKSGPALILQEFGNLGTIFIALPIAVFGFSMGRQAIGAAFSTSREGSLAIVGNIYGLDSPEGQGVMGAYITGTVFGTVFCGILASLCAGSGLFHPHALGMAAGTGSASMMAASLAPVVEAFPDVADEVTSFAAASQVLTSVDGMYMSLLLALPLTEWLYKKFKGPERFAKAEAKRVAKEMEEAGEEVDQEELVRIQQEELAAAEAATEEEEAVPLGERWFVRIKVLLFSGVFAAIGNYIATGRTGEATTPLESLPGLALMFAVICLSYLIDDIVRAKLKWNLPSIIYLSALCIICSLPGLKIGGFEFGKFFYEKTSMIGLLPLCTPILAYAGISIGKDLESFKQQGIGIVLTAIGAFTGTYLGSAIIAQIVLKLTKQI